MGDILKTGASLVQLGLAIAFPEFAPVILVAGALVQVGLSEIMGTDMPSFDLAAQNGRGLRLNACSTQEDIRVIYGKTRVGGNDVFRVTTGTDNNVLWIVMGLGEGECDGIAQVDGVDQVFLGEKLYSEYGGNVAYWFHAGTATQECDANLHSAYPDWDDNLRDLCYVVFKLTYDRDYFQSLPARTVLLKGRKLYDFRDGTTAWSDNPVLCLYDYMTNTRYGMGIDASAVDIDSWTSTANYCDTKGWGLNMVVARDQAAQDLLDAMCAHFRGEMIWYDGKFYLSYADLNYESIVMPITDAHIVQDASGKASVSIAQPGRFSRPDGIRVKYINPDAGYVVDDLIVGDSEGVIREAKFLGCADRQMAADLGVYLLKRAQLDRTITLCTRDDCVRLDPHDLVSLTTSALNISGQVMRVTDTAVRPDGFVDLILQYEDQALYNDDYDLETDAVYATTLPDPADVPPGVGNVSVTEETYHYRLRSFTRLKITFDTITYPWFDHLEVWTSLDDITYKHQFNTTDNFNLDNVQEGETWYIKLRMVTIWGRKQAMADAYKAAHLVGGRTSAPTSVTALAAAVNSNAVNLYADRVNDADVELYEFRLGSSWSGAIFLGAFRSPNMSLYGVRPGEHTFYLNTLGNNGVYGDTPRSAVFSLDDPPEGWTVQHTEACDYDGVGTHDNTEHTTYGSDDYLKCSHSSGVLTGVYTSPVYDLGASGKYLVYVLADIVVTGAGTTWGDIVPSPNTWDDLVVSRTWAEIFELASGPSVAVSLKYGDTNPPTNEVKRLEILSTLVTARYYQVEVTITDPSSEVNALVEHFTLKFCQQ